MKKMEIQTILNKLNRDLLSFNFDSIPDGLNTGKLGVIIYLLSVYDSSNDIEYLDKIENLLNIVIDNCNNNPANSVISNSSLSEGISGLGIVTNTLLRYDILDKSYKDYLETVSQLSYENCMKMIEKNNYSFFDGAFGNLYFLISTNNIKRCNDIVNLLYDKFIINKKKFYTEVNDVYADGINFGMNHGYLSVIKVLLLYSPQNLKSKEIITSCIKTIIDNLNNNYLIDNVHIFKPYNISYSFGELVPHQNNRLCWCNSDLSLAYILYLVSDKLKYKECEKLAARIGLETTKRRSLENTGVELPQFCHGSAGIAELYSLLYNIDGKSSYYKANKYWLDRTINYLKEETSWKVEDLSLLYGKLGAIMVLNDSAKKYLTFLI